METDLLITNRNEKSCGAHLETIIKQETKIQRLLNSQ